MDTAAAMDMDIHMDQLLSNSSKLLKITATDTDTADTAYMADTSGHSKSLNWKYHKVATEMAGTGTKTTNAWFTQMLIATIWHTCYVFLRTHNKNND